MAIYKPRASRWPLLLAVGAVALVIGFAAGALFAGSKPVDLAGAARTIGDDLQGSAGLLEVVEIEYREALSASGTQAEFQAALDNLDRSRERYDGVRSALVEIDPGRVSRIDGGFDSVRAALEARVEVDQVAADIEVLRGELSGT
jgi:hypothetical protein